MLELAVKSLSLSDPEAKKMKSREGYFPAYNVQSVIDKKHHLIALSTVKDQPIDNLLLSEMVNETKDELGQYPEVLSADKGYYNPVEIEKAEENVDTYIPVPVSIRDRDEIKFTYDEINDRYTCQMGRTLVLVARMRKKKNRFANQYRSKDCSECPLKPKCTKSDKGRVYYKYTDEAKVNKYKEKMKTSLARLKVSLRKMFAEHPHGTLKMLMGKIPLLLRGKVNVQTEINIYATVYNIKRFMNIEPFDLLMGKIEGFNWKTA